MSAPTSPSRATAPSSSDPAPLTQRPPAGWYPAPDGRSGEAYWDGASWRLDLYRGPEGAHEVPPTDGLDRGLPGALELKTHVRRVRAAVIAGIAAVSIGGGVTAILVLSGRDRTSVPAGNATAGVYRQKLTSALAPVVTANRALSGALEAIDGSENAIAAAKKAATQAELAVVAAQGALAVLTVPSSESMLSQQSRQALTEDRSYLKAVSATLSDPAGESASQLQTMATNAQTAMAALTSVAAGAADSLRGTDNLLSWVASATRQAEPGTPSTDGSSGAPATSYLTPSGKPVPGTWSDVPADFASATGTPYRWNGGQQCDQNIFAGDATSCALANNIFMVVAAASHYAGIIPGSISAYSPATRTSYDLTCTEYWGNDHQNDVQCVTANGAGAAFPVSSADVYYG